MSEKAMQKKRGGRVLDFIERAGNRLPHPYILFLWLCLILAVISMLCSAAGVSVVNPTTGDTVTSNSLISKDGFVWLLENLLTNFQTFTPLGLVLAMQIAIGFAEKVGLLTTAMRRAILGGAAVVPDRHRAVSGHQWKHCLRGFHHRSSRAGSGGF